LTTFVEEHKDRFPVEVICSVINFPVSTYYAAKKSTVAPSQRSRRDTELLPLIRDVWAKSKQLYGARKVWKQLQRDGIEVARCTVERLMRIEGISGAVSTRARPRTTVPGDARARPRDLVERDFRAPAPNQLWVTDITYVPLVGGGFVYAAFVTDVYSRAIVGWQVLDTLKAELALDALEMALWSRRDGLSTALVHHSDRGVQYTAVRYGQRLQEAGIERSVGRKGDSYDNALAESINALYKKEVITRGGPWNSVSEVTGATGEWIHWYNNVRLHSWCGDVPPLEFEQTYRSRPPMAA
jgi:transposase InsO family protein